jgi:Mrp family chromosome partitioning ATPase
VPKFTKKYWVDWQRGGKRIEGGWVDEEPLSERITIKDMASEKDPETASTNRMSRGGEGETAEPAPQAAPDRSMVVASRRPSVPAHPADPPTIVVAPHDFRPELATDPRLVLVREPDGARAAAYRVLRHHVTDEGNPQVIVVSSADRNEGKTTCALNLALALGECRRARVLLVEAHFRNPQLVSVFRFQPPWCFAQQIVEHRARPLERWSVVEIAPFGLHVAAVDPRTEQRPLLDAPAFAFAMERLRQAGYDHIVVDAPPVLGTAEVNLLQDAADAVLLTAWSGTSRRSPLRAAIEQLSPGSILGVVVLEG